MATYTVDSFVGAPEDVLTKLYDLAEIPVDFVYTFPRGFFRTSGNARGVPNPNAAVLNVGQSDLYPDPVLAGFSLAPLTFDNFAVTHTTSGNACGHISMWGIDMLDMDSTPGIEVVYDALPEYVEHRIPNCTSIADEVFYRSYSDKPYKAYAGFELRADAPDGTVFVDNLGFAGYLYIDARANTGTAGTPGGAQAMFCGLLKRNAKGKAAMAIVDSDIVVGTIQQGTSARVVVNGSIIWSRNNFPVSDRTELEMVFEAWPVYDQSPAVISAADHDTISMEVGSAYICGNSADYQNDMPPEISGGLFVTVSFANAVFAAVSDYDVSPCTDPWWPQASITAGDYWANDVSFGAFYTGGPTTFWSERVKSIEEV